MYTRVFKFQRAHDSREILLLVALVCLMAGCCLRRPHMTAGLTWTLNNCCCIPEFRCELQRDTCIFITFSNCHLDSECWSHECPHKCCLLFAGQQFNYPKNMQMSMRVLSVCLKSRRVGAWGLEVRFKIALVT